MKVKLLVMLLLSAVCVSAAGQSINGSGGTLNAPRTLTTIAVNNVTTNVGIIDVNCNVTFFGVSTYLWNWKCTGGNVKLNGSVIGTVSDSNMTYRCMGGGRDTTTKCIHVLSGFWFDVDGIYHAFTISSGKGDISKVSNLSM